jgi:hydroxypyruvate reductase
VLESIYLQTLERCRPETLVHVPDDAPRDVVAIGKCAAALFRGVREYRDSLVIVPEGYPGVGQQTADSGQQEIVVDPLVAVGRPLSAVRRVECLTGGHPEYTPASFAAGKQLLEFVDAHDDILFLISGGGSACVEWPLPGFTQEQLTKINHELITSGRPIGEINAERRKYSAIKGGRLGARVRGRCLALIYSDVSTGRLEDVASGPVLKNMQLMADNATLVRAAAELAGTAIIWNEQIECDVQTAAERLAEAARKLKPAEVLVAGGEPTVEHHGSGKGGRCCELAARFALQQVRDVDALFGSSDGVDGNSGIAGAVIPANAAVDRHRIESHLADSNSLAVVEMYGRAIMIPPTGNNLRDLVLLARA